MFKYKVCFSFTAIIPFIPPFLVSQLSYPSLIVSHASTPYISSRCPISQQHTIITVINMSHHWFYLPVEYHTAQDSDEAPLNATSLSPMVHIHPYRIQASSNHSTGSQLWRLGIHDQCMACRTSCLVLSLFLWCFPQLLYLTRVQRLIIYASCACWIPFNRTDIPLINSGLSCNRLISSAEEADDVRQLGVKCCGVDWSCIFKLICLLSWCKATKLNNLCRQTDLSFQALVCSHLQSASHQLIHI